MEWAYFRPDPSRWTVPLRDGSVRNKKYARDSLSRWRNILEISVGETSVRDKLTLHHPRATQETSHCKKGRAGHSLIFTWFAIRSPLNFFLWIADAHAFIFWISLFARRSNARRSTSGSLSEKGLNHSSLSINLSYIYLSKVLCLSLCHCVIVAECWAILYVLVIKLSKEMRRRVYRLRDREGRDWRGGCERIILCLSLIWETCRFTVPPAVAFMN